MSMGRKVPDHVKNGGFQVTAGAHALRKLIKLGLGRKAIIEQKVGDFFKRAVFCKVCNRKTPVVQFAQGTVNLTD
jgi:hypothetical protein